MKTKAFPDQLMEKQSLKKILLFIQIFNTAGQGELQYFGDIKNYQIKIGTILYTFQTIF